jgi:hypothetical protein
VLLLITQALPQLERHRHPNLGRLIVPGHYPRLGETLALGFNAAADNGCFSGYDPDLIERMVDAISALPPRLPGARAGRFLWLAVPDVVRCTCGAENHCPQRTRTDLCGPAGDARATLERFREWHPRLVHLPLAYVLQEGCEHGEIPWDAEGLRAVFLGAGSDAWRYGETPARLVREARERGLYAHMGRVSSRRAARYARSLGCTSIDGTIFVRWRDHYLEKGLRWVSEPGPDPPYLPPPTGVTTA